MQWRVIITEQSGKDLTDYQVRVEVTDPDFFRICTDQKFVEFYDEDRTTLLNHYTEEFDLENNKAVFWVKVPSIPANGTKTIYLNVNTERTEDLSNPEAVFEFFDHFDTADKWSLYGNSSIHDSVLDYTLGGSDYVVEKTTKLPSRNIVIEHLTKVVSRKGPNAGIDIMIPTTTAGGDDQAVSGNWYLVAFESAGHYKIYEHTGTTYTNIRDISYSIPTGQWLRCKTIINETADGVRIRFYVNDELIDDFTDTTPITPQDGYLAFREGDMEHDWVFVRKFTEPEPTVTVVKAMATPTLDLKKMIANCLAGKKAKILDNYPIIRLKSGDTVIKDIQAIAKHVKVDEANSRYIVMFLFIDDSSDTYTTDNQELWFPHPDGNYLAFTQTQTFEKTADEPLPLRWEIYLPYSVDELDGQII